MHRIRDSSSPVDTNPKLPEHEHLNCPRCRSTNTKFCYYNNYNLSQPRHYCKHCRRYWTKGGTLRNIPIGGATRKITKRASPVTKTTAPPPLPAPAKPEPELEHSAMGPFGSLLMEVSVGDESGSNYLRLNDENNGNGGSERGETSCWNGWLA